MDNQTTKPLTIEELKPYFIERYERLLKEEQFHLSILSGYNLSPETIKVLQESSIATIDILIDSINRLKND